MAQCLSQRISPYRKKTPAKLGVALNEFVATVSDPGRTYFEHFAKAFSRAREHRNRFVHGLWATVPAAATHPAIGILLNARPKAGAQPMPAQITAAEIQSVADHVVDLSNFAQQIHVAFTASGERRLNANGAPEVSNLPSLPPLPPLLPTCAIDYFDPSELPS